VKNLDYKGIKSTRVIGAIVVFVAACCALWFGKITGDQWLTATQWIFGIYAASEVGSKGAEAVRDRGVSAGPPA